MEGVPVPLIFCYPHQKDLETAGCKLKYLNVSRPLLYLKNERKMFHLSKYLTYAVRIIFEAKKISTRGTMLADILTYHRKYQYKPDRTRDWVKEPKSNGYEALHLTVMGPGKWIEVRSAAKA